MTEWLTENVGLLTENSVEKYIAYLYDRMVDRERWFVDGNLVSPAMDSRQDIAFHRTPAIKGISTQEYLRSKSGYEKVVKLFRK